MPNIPDNNTSTEPEIGLLPDFCDVRIIFMVVLLVEVLAMVLTMAIPTTTSAYWDHLAFISMLMQWIALLCAAALCHSRKWLNRMDTRNTLFISFAIMMAVSLVVSLVMLQLQGLLGLDDITSPLGEHFLLRIMLMSAAMYALVLRYFYIQYQWRSNLHAQSRAEIQALKARIRPHFLFNSMNTIASLISFKPESAEKAVEDLADLFRASLQEKNINTLEDEIALTRSYLDIEKLRLGERLDVEWDIDNSLKNQEIPSLSLQPLAENAIYHGIEPLTGGGSIHISATRQGEHLVLEVSNPIDESSTMPHKKGNQMAQQNIRQRLELAYGSRAEFNTNETKHSYSIQLRIPLEL
jgi:two-component system sensor histidine kinase AlgZ